MDKKKSYAEPEVVDDSEDDSEAEDGTKIKPKLKDCPHAAAAEDSEDEDFDMGAAPAAADSDNAADSDDSDDFEMGATVPAPARATPRAARAPGARLRAARRTSPVPARSTCAASAATRARRRTATRTSSYGRTLRAGQGIAELKKMVRQIAGKYAHHRWALLKIGGPGGRNAKKNDNCAPKGAPADGNLLFAMMFGGGGGDPAGGRQGRRARRSRVRYWVQLAVAEVDYECLTTLTI